VKRALVAAVVVAGAIAIGLFAYFELRQPGDVRGSSTAEFVTTATPTVPKKPPEPGVLWPTYGYSADRLRVGPGKHRPPYRRVWFFGARDLIEFPPVIAYGRLFFANESGTVFAINAKTGKRAWKRDTGRCQAASPAVDDHIVYVTFLRRCAGQRSLDGLVVAYNAGTGRVLWQKRIGQSESSPIVYKGRLYLGDWSGRVYAFDAQTGKLVWQFQSQGKIGRAHV